MNTGGRQLLLSALAVMLSLVIVTGSLLLSMVEGGMVAALPASQTPTQTLTITLTPLAPTPQAVFTQDETSEISLTLTSTWTPVPTATETPPPPTNCPPPSGWVAIQTGPGDTLESLAAAYNTTVEDLMRFNCLLTTQILPGTRLYVPPFKSPTPAAQCTRPAGWIDYIVQPGDTLYRLSLMFKVSVYQLQVINCLPSSRIQVGQRLWVPNLPTWTPVILSPTPTLTMTFTPVPTSTRTPTPTVRIVIPTTAVPSETPTSTSTPTLLPTLTPTVTPTFTVTPVPTDTPTPTDTTVPPPESNSAEQNTYH